MRTTQSLRGEPPHILLATLNALAGESRIECSKGGLGVGQGPASPTLRPAVSGRRLRMTGVDPSSVMKGTPMCHCIAELVTERLRRYGSGTLGARQLAVRCQRNRSELASCCIASRRANSARVIRRFVTVSSISPHVASHTISPGYESPACRTTCARRTLMQQELHDEHAKPTPDTCHCNKRTAVCTGAISLWGQ